MLFFMEQIKYLDLNTHQKLVEKRYTNETYEGIVTNLERRYMETSSTWIRDWIDGYMIENTCPTCKGSRLKSDILNIKINNKNIYEVTNMSIKDLITFLIN